jgi:hypothetical protein
MTRFIAVLLTALTILSVQEIQAACLTLTWTAPGDDGYSGVATRYDIRYSTSPVSMDNWDLAYPVRGVSRPGAAGAAEGCLVTGLVSGTVYYFGLRTADERDNWSPISNIAVATAPDDKCHGLVGNADCSPDGVIDITDIATVIDHLFLSLRPLCCPAEANVSGDPEGNVDITDVSNLIWYLFISASETPSCPAE